MMCIIALQNSASGAIKLLGKDDPDVKAYLPKSQSLKHVRDISHPLRRVRPRRGKAQKSLDGTTGPFGWMPMWNADETFLI